MDTRTPLELGLDSCYSGLGHALLEDLRKACGVSTRLPQLPHESHATRRLGSSPRTGSYTLAPWGQNTCSVEQRCNGKTRYSWYSWVKALVTHVYCTICWASTWQQGSFMVCRQYPCITRRCSVTRLLDVVKDGIDYAFQVSSNSVNDSKLIQ